MNITAKDFMRIQPNRKKVADTDVYYLQLALQLDTALEGADLQLPLDTHTKRDIVIAAIGYFQDIVADCGIWRSFITIHNKLYGKPLPFYQIPDGYCESELNAEDLQFLVWYVMETHSADFGMLSPLHADIAQIAHLFFDILDKEYLEAPHPTEYTLAMDVELDNVGQAQDILDLSSWLFWDSYLMPHAATGAISEAMAEARQIIAKHPDHNEAAPHLSNLNDRVMLSNPTGPLALTVGEWLKMIVDGQLPDTDDSAGATTTHKFYKQLIAATGGKQIAFFNSYDALEAFLSDEMGWGQASEGHLPNLRKFDNFVVFGTPAKGILVAHDVAQYINHPDNPYYSQQAAESDGYKLLTTRGGCPIDLIKHAFANHLMDDAHLPYDVTGEITRNNWDFLARLYQQRFYRPE